MRSRLIRIIITAVVKGRRLFSGALQVAVVKAVPVEVVQRLLQCEPIWNFAVAIGQILNLFHPCGRNTISTGFVNQLLIFAIHVRGSCGIGTDAFPALLIAAAPVIRFCLIFPGIFILLFAALRVKIPVQIVRQNFHKPLEVSFHRNQ